MRLHSIQFNSITSHHITCIHIHVFISWYSKLAHSTQSSKKLSDVFNDFSGRISQKIPCFNRFTGCGTGCFSLPLVPASVRYKKLLQKTPRPTRRHERHKLDHNRPSSVSIPHLHAVHKGDDYVFLVFQKTQRLQASIHFLHKVLDENIFDQLLFRRHRFLLHTEARNSRNIKLLGVDEPITIQNSEVKQPLCPAVSPMPQTSHPLSPCAYPKPTHFIHGRALQAKQCLYTKCPGHSHNMSIPW